MKTILTPPMNDIKNLIVAAGCMSNRQIHCMLSTMDSHVVDKIIHSFLSQKILETMEWNGEQIFYVPGYQNLVSQEGLLSIWVLINSSTKYVELQTVMKETFPSSICFVSASNRIQKLVPIILPTEDKLAVIVNYLQKNYEHTKLLFNNQTPPVSYTLIITDESYLHFFEKLSVTVPYCIAVIKSSSADGPIPTITYYQE